MAWRGSLAMIGLGALFLVLTALTLILPIQDPDVAQSLGLVTLPLALLFLSVGGFGLWKALRLARLGRAGKP